jgi:hypothetical protein
MKKTTKKLVLAKETVRSLGERQDNLKNAAGGRPPISRTDCDFCYTQECTGSCL